MYASECSADLFLLYDITYCHMYYRHIIGIRSTDFVDKEIGENTTGLQLERQKLHWTNFTLTLHKLKTFILRPDSIRFINILMSYFKLAED